METIASAQPGDDMLSNTKTDVRLKKLRPDDPDSIFNVVILGDAKEDDNEA